MKTEKVAWISIYIDGKLMWDMPVLDFYKKPGYTDSLVCEGEIVVIRFYFK